MARAARPGQFVIVMSHENGERIPLTIADFDADRKTDHAGNSGGREDHARDAADVSDRDAVVCTGRGRWACRATSRARRKWCSSAEAWVSRRFIRRRARAKQSGAYVIGVVGFRNRELVFWEDKFRACCDELIDLHRRRFGRHQGPGDRGHPRRARHDIRTSTSSSRSARPIMMKGCAEATRAHKIKTMVSLNPDHGRRHRHVRRLPREDRRAREVRVRRRPGLRRASRSTSTI